MDIIRITKGQVKQIAREISQRWQFVNHRTYYNCIDTKTGQQSIEGGRYNFAHYYFTNAVRQQYLKLIGKDDNYLHYQFCGVDNSNNRNSYLIHLSWEIEKLLCGFTCIEREAARQRFLDKLVS